MGEGLHLKRWGFQCGRNAWACNLVGRDLLKVIHSVPLDHSLARFSDHFTGSLPFKVGSTFKAEDGQRDGKGSGVVGMILKPLTSWGCGQGAETQGEPRKDT